MKDVSAMGKQSVIENQVSKMFDVPPLRFFDNRTERQMMYVYPDTKHWCAGWLLYQTKGNYIHES